MSLRYCSECKRTIAHGSAKSVTTRRGVYCDAECLAEAEIADLERFRRAMHQPALCPICREAAATPAHGWTCSDACGDTYSASLTGGAA